MALPRSCIATPSSTSAPTQGHSASEEAPSRCAGAGTRSGLRWEYLGRDRVGSSADVPLGDIIEQMFFRCQEIWRKRFPSQICVIDRSFIERGCEAQCLPQRSRDAGPLVNEPGLLRFPAIPEARIFVAACVPMNSRNASAFRYESPLVDVHHDTDGGIRISDLRSPNSSGRRAGQWFPRARIDGLAGV